MGPSALTPGRATPDVFWGGPVSVQSRRTNPFNSDVSTTDTIRVMRLLARRYFADPSVQAATAQALSRLSLAAPQRDLASAIFHWIRANVRFVEDETLMYTQLGVPAEHLDKELLIVPPVLLSMPVPMGDCDDFTLLAACQLLCAGLRPYFVTVAANPADPMKFDHIYICARLEDEDSYICLDAGNRFQGIPPGWEVSKVTRKAIWAV